MYRFVRYIHLQDLLPVHLLHLLLQNCKHNAYVFADVAAAFGQMCLPVSLLIAAHAFADVLAGLLANLCADMVAI